MQSRSYTLHIGSYKELLPLTIAQEHIFVNKSTEAKSPQKYYNTFNEGLGSSDYWFYPSQKACWFYAPEAFMENISLISPENFINTCRKKNKYALFVGAGISRSAGILLGQEIIRDLQTKYVKKFVPGGNYSYGDALNTAFPDPSGKEERRRYFDRLCRGKTPEDEHHLIAQLAEKGFFKTIISTNFDHLLEFALHSRCSLWPKIYLHDENLEKYPYEIENVRLIKLHGDFLFDDFANLSDELKTRLNDNMEKKLSIQLADSGLIIVGFSGTDKTILQWLRKMIKDKKALPHGIWWVCFDSKEIPSRCVRELIAEANNNSKPSGFIGYSKQKCFPKEFFNVLCAELEIQKPLPMPFGINSAWHNMTCVIGCDAGRARQIPPIVHTDKLSPEILEIKSEVSRIVSKSGVVWLSGPAGSGKTTLVCNIFHDAGLEKCFYFNPRFSRNPIDNDIKLDIETFASESAINPTQTTSHTELIDILVQNGTIFIFDDIVFGLQFEGTEFKAIIQYLIASHWRFRNGAILIVSTNKPPLSLIESLAPLPFVDNFICFTKMPKQRVLDNTARFVKQESSNIIILQCLSDFRFGETRNILSNYLANLTDNPPKILEKLTSGNLLEQLGDRLVLHEVSHEYLSEKTSSKTRAAFFAKIMQINSENRKSRQDSLHYSLEAIEKFISSGDITSAITMGLNISGNYIHRGFSHYGIYTLLLNLKLIMEKEHIIQKMDTRHQMMLLLMMHKTTDMLSHSTRSDAPNTAQELRNYFGKIKTQINLPKSWRELLLGLVAIDNRNYHEAIIHLETASLLFKEHGDFNNFIETEIKIFEAHCKLVDQLQEKGQIEEAEKYDKLGSCAEHVVKEAGNKNVDKLLLAKALDNFAAVKLRQGHFSDVLNLCNAAADTICANEGLSDDRAVILGNYFYAYLGLFREAVEKHKDLKKAKDYLKLAEGFFMESNQNFARAGQCEPVMQHLDYIWRMTHYPSVSNFLPNKEVLKHILSSYRFM